MSLTIERARAVIAAAEAKATEIGVPVIVAVLDAGVHLKAFSRMDGAPLGSIDVASWRSGFGEGAAIGMAKNGHQVIATAQISPQVAAFRRKVDELGLKNLRVEKLDLLDPYDSDTPFRWLDDSRHFTKRAEMRATFDSLLGTPQGRLDPAEMIARMIEVVPSDTGKFRNVVPQFVEDMLKQHQLDAWKVQI